MSSDFTTYRTAEGVTAVPTRDNPEGGILTPAQIEAVKTKASVDSMREGFAAQNRSATQVGREIAPGVVVSSNDTREITEDTRVRVDGQTEVTLGDLKAYAPDRLGSFRMAGRRA